jgi:UPF0755 protein
MINRDNLLIVASTYFLISVLMVFLSRYTRLENPSAIKVSEPVLLLYDGGTLTELTAIMRENGIEFDEMELQWASRILGWGSFRSGRYVLEPNMSYEAFLGKLVRGLQDPARIVIGAGLEQERLITRVANQFRFTADELRSAMNDPDILAELNIEPQHLIGRILPNSYELFWTASPEQFLKRMLQEFDRLVTDPYFDRIVELGMTVDEITTLGSIIEWEVRFVDEKPRVSGLYWNRLRIGMRLQADPTVNYAIGERRRLFNSDYLVNHPYNTYRINGLPPGPLNNPRISSIEAALYPESHNFFFMVATPDGYHTFTRTYDEHLRESRKWTNWLREQRQIRQQREAAAAINAQTDVAQGR